MGAATVIGVGIGLQAYGTYQGLKSSEAQAKFQAGVDRTNAKIKKERIKDITTIGLKEARRLETETISDIGEQVTGFASGGIDVSSAVVTELAEETARFGAADIITLQHNIKRAVWGEEVGIMSDEMSELFNRKRARSIAKLAPIATVGAVLPGLGALALRSPNPLQRTPPRTSPRGSGDILGLGPNVSVNLPGGI